MKYVTQTKYLTGEHMQKRLEKLDFDLNHIYLSHGCKNTGPLATEVMNILIREKDRHYKIGKTLKKYGIRDNSARLKTYEAYYCFLSKIEYVHTSEIKQLCKLCLEKFLTSN